MEQLWIAVVLGIVEGLTEFIPVSSTGHLIVTGSLLGLTGEKSKTFEIVIQLGAILSVVLHYRQRFWQLLDFKERRVDGFAGWRGCLLLAITTTPILVVGGLFHGFLKANLFNPMTVAWALGVGGVAILVVERWRPAPDTEGLDRLRWNHALGIGLFQCLALWPGMSRSAATILGGMLGRVERRTAAEYSFLAAVPTLTAATAYDLYKSWYLLGIRDLPFFVLGFVTSFFAAWLAVEWFLKQLQRGTLCPYGWYRVIIAPIIYYYLRS